MATSWRGREVVAKVREASRLGVDQTTAAAATHAKDHHTWDNVTGTAEGSIGMRPATVEGSTVRGEFGSYGVDYFDHLERGTVNMQPRPSLRPAIDEEAPKMPGRVRANYEEL